MAEGKEYSYITGRVESFVAVDYVLFAFTLLVSAGIGVFYAIKDRNVKTTKSYLLAGGNMSVWPAALSLVASFMSAITLLGTPAEIYNFDTMFMDMTLAYIVSMFLAAYVYIPILYRLHITSVYEYLEKRFCKGVRLLGSTVYCTMMIIYMSIVLYGPSLALNAVTGFTLWGAVVTVGAVCTFYTSLGGMKAVMWTDSFQTIMMIMGLLIVLIKGSMEVGGFGNAWNIASENGRIKFGETSLDPRVRHTVWTFLIGGSFLWTSIYGTNQAQAQRMFSLPSLKKAQIAIWLNFPCLLIILYLCGMIGVVMYAFYSKCDPITFGLISASDQMVPLFVMDTLSHLPGIPGMFLASIFSGTLSSVATGMNSISAVILQDFLRPYCLKGLSEKKATLVSRILAIFLGLLCLVMTYGVSKLGGILQAALALYGCLSAPMLGVFSLGMLFPWSNKWGAYSGTLSSIAIMTWVSVSHYESKIKPPMSPISVEQCNWNLTLKNTLGRYSIANETQEYIYPTGLDGLYNVSYLWYNVFAVFIVIIVGMIVSLATGCQDPKQVDPKLICPIFDILCPYLPEKFKEKLHFGVNHKNKYDDEPATTEPVLLSDNPKTNNASADVVS